MKVVRRYQLSFGHVSTGLAEKQSLQSCSTDLETFLDISTKIYAKLPAIGAIK